MEFSDLEIITFFLMEYTIWNGTVIKKLSFPVVLCDLYFACLAL